MFFFNLMVKHFFRVCQSEYSAHFAIGLSSCFDPFPKNSQLILFSEQLPPICYPFSIDLISSHLYHTALFLGGMDYATTFPGNIMGAIFFYDHHYLLY